MYFISIFYLEVAEKVSCAHFIPKKKLRLQDVKGEFRVRSQSSAFPSITWWYLHDSNHAGNENKSATIPLGSKVSSLLSVNYLTIKLKISNAFLLSLKMNFGWYWKTYLPFYYLHSCTGGISNFFLIWTENKSQPDCELTHRWFPW